MVTINKHGVTEHSVMELEIWDSSKRDARSRSIMNVSKSWKDIAAILCEYDAISCTIGVHRIAMTVPVFRTPTYPDLMDAMVEEIRDRIAALPEWYPKPEDALYKNCDRFRCDADPDTLTLDGFATVMPAHYTEASFK